MRHKQLPLHSDVPADYPTHAAGAKLFWCNAAAAGNVSIYVLMRLDVCPCRYSPFNTIQMTALALALSYSVQLAGVLLQPSDVTFTSMFYTPFTGQQVSESACQGGPALCKLLLLLLLLLLCACGAYK